MCNSVGVKWQWGFNIQSNVSLVTRGMIKFRHCNNTALILHFLYLKKTKIATTIMQSNSNSIFSIQYFQFNKEFQFVSTGINNQGKSSAVFSTTK